ncbi:MAG: SDR family oxidoreductase [Chloroflexi bacterium AL-W]|nr:SDR family oxidoreductase [Chloroflexi bacterium AL-N1]NOK70795.1 SDR family oxidoreductase [Chloroflexi bacterium AL-N10]NOK78355.1 SDR family oxidoreductase [Chloroflexi bacterium AL-N5]NOK85336.1 SDR family oxidoreductase [Chloroflexi bacterium AL-W]NOK92612.1 SDR family oxidoreductase [Chloroflexi bacterium AL-N15]
MSELSGKIAVVTGGGRGIGRASALALAQEGAAVAITGRNQTVLDAVRDEIMANGGTAFAITCDVADPAAVSTAFETIRTTLGPITILVNNAGITASIKFTDMDVETWEHIMRVNASGPFFCCKAVVPDMLAQQWGRIINIASIAALYGLPYSSAYSASKHALLGLTRSLALELVRANITANAICPGWVETDMLQEAVANIAEKTGRTAEEARASLLSQAHQQRVVTPDEVAAVIVRLTSPTNTNTNGEAITIA